MKWFARGPWAFISSSFFSTSLLVWPEGTNRPVSLPFSKNRHVGQAFTFNSLMTSKHSLLSTSTCMIFIFWLSNLSMLSLIRDGTGWRYPITLEDWRSSSINFLCSLEILSVLYHLTLFFVVREVAFRRPKFNINALALFVIPVILFAEQVFLYNKTPHFYFEYSILNMLILGPVSEEIFFRGYL